MKFREVKGAKKRIEGKDWDVVTRPLEEEGETKIAPSPPKTPKTTPSRPKTVPRGANTAPNAKPRD